MKISTFAALVGDDNTIPGLGSATVVPHDTADFTDQAGNRLVARALEILASGDVTFVGYDGSEDTRTVTDAMVPYLLPVAVVRVTATGTTVAAGSIKAIW